MSTPIQRHLTISRTVPVSRARRRACPLPEMPFIRLGGRWLERAGFGVGKQVRVLVREGVMIIEVVEG